MQADPQPFRPATAILTLGDALSDTVAAADFPETILRFRNDRAAAEVGLDGLTDEAWIAHFGRFQPLAQSLERPRALRYHGHQFRSYNPEIGDGRGFLFAQLYDAAGRLMDLGTKGSGTTPYSRFGDGRLTLKGGVREVLATEMLEALGVETSRTFSLIETGEQLHRGDEPSPTRSAVLVRLSHGHIRIGSFQRLATLNDPVTMQALTAYCLHHFFGEGAPEAEGAAARLLAHVVARTARLAASYMAAGFVHGVLNSDNINVTGESFDYGPWRWAPTWDVRFTAAYFDHQGLYAFGRQPEAIHWDVVQLARALVTIAPPETLAPELDRFPALYEAALRDALLARLGVAPSGDDARDFALLGTMEAALGTEAGTPPVGIDRFFFDWRGGRLRAAHPASDQAVYDQARFASFREAVAAFAPAATTDHEYWSDAEPCAMLIDEVEAIWAPIAADDDWRRLEAKIAAVRRMGAALRTG